jgi:integrase
MGAKVRKKDGAYYVFVNHRGKRKAKKIGVGEQARKAAEKAAAKIQAKLALGEFCLVEPTIATFREYAETWLSTYAKTNCREGYGFKVLRVVA